MLFSTKCMLLYPFLVILVVERPVGEELVVSPGDVAVAVQVATDPVAVGVVEVALVGQSRMVRPG